LIGEGFNKQSEIFLSARLFNKEHEIFLSGSNIRCVSHIQQAARNIFKRVFHNFCLRMRLSFKSCFIFNFNKQRKIILSARLFNKEHEIFFIRCVSPIQQAARS
jgi:hypothetical protein